MQNAPVFMRWLALMAGAFMFWTLMFVICPAINRTFPAMARMASVVDAYGLRTGMFFYTDVEITADANIETANTVRFMPTGGKNRERR